MKVIIASSIVMIVALAAVTGITYSWFSDSEESTIDITTGKVDIDIHKDAMELYSWNNGSYELQTDGKFAPGGTASITENSGSLSVSLKEIAPGDKVVLKINIENKSNISCKYRYSITCNSYYGLIDGLNIKADYNDTVLSGPGYSEWLDSISLNGTISIELPITAGNEYQGKGLELKFTVEAYQSDAIDTSTYTITSEDDLRLFAYSVNNGTTYAGKKVVLMNDIDLDNRYWTPIGTEYNIFKGTFDGNGHTISNLTTGRSWMCDVGLFGYTTNGEIKNLTVHNAKVTGYLDVGVVAGTPYTSKYTNISVTVHVEVNGYAYVGGVGGKNAYANWTDITVDVDDSSYVKANSEGYRTYVGGAIGFMGEGNQVMKNITSNIDVTGSTCDVGGITGMAHYGNTFVNCSSSGDVTLVNATDAGDQLEIGGIAGVWHNESGHKVTFTDCSFTGTLSSKLNGVEETNFENNGLVGRQYSSVWTGELIINP